MTEPPSIKPSAIEPSATEPNSKDRISQLEEQVAFLMGELERERRRSDSLWGAIYAAFIDEDNGKEEAQFWADRISALVADWVNNRRENLNQRILATGAMPPYSDCLNELSISISPPGSTPAPLPEFNPLHAQHTIGTQAAPTSGSYPPYQPYQPYQPPTQLPSIPTTVAMTPSAPQQAAVTGERIAPRVNVPRPFAVSIAANVPSGAVPSVAPSVDLSVNTAEGM
jgi:hypothetical protein